MPGTTTAPSPGTAPSADTDARSRRDLRLFLVGQVASVFGSTLTGSAISLVAVAELGATASQVSFVLAAGTVPALLFGPVCGVLMDRVPRPRRMLVIADLVAVLAVGACAVAAFTGTLSILMLAGLAVALRAVGLVVESLYFSHLHALGVSDVRAARGKLQSSEMLARAAAGTLGGPVVAALGSALLFVADVVTYLFSAAMLMALTAPDTRPAPTAPRAGIRTEFVAGLTAVRGNPVLLAYVVYLALGVLATSGVAVQRAVFLLEDLQLPVALYTLPTVAATIAGSLGALLAPKVLARGVSAQSVLLVGMPAAAVSTAALPLAGGGPAGVLTAMVVSTALPLLFGAVVNIALVGVIDEEVGDAYFGRVTTLLGSVATLSATVGALAGGVLATTFGTRTGIWLCVALDTVAALLLVLVLRRGSRTAERS